MKFLSLLTLFVSAFSLTLNADACSRITYTTADNSTIITGRNMDWHKTFKTALRVYKRGTIYKSFTTENPVTWTAKYGSVGIWDADLFLNAGINEAGLAGDFLWLEGADYGTPKDEEQTISVVQYLQYLLDNFATVQEVADFIKEGSLRPITTTQDTPGSFKMQIHWMLTDKTGDNIIIEYVNGDVKTYREHGRMVMTNEPSYEKMQALSEYYKKLGIENNMPGSAMSEARFIYLTGWLDQFVDTPLTNYQPSIPNHDFKTQALMSVVSLMRGVSTPLGVQFSEEHPNNSSTIYRTYVDLKNNMFYYDSALAPTFIWLDLNKVDFSKNKTLDLASGQILNGDALTLLEDVK